jgi:hypothetical protein
MAGPFEEAKHKTKCEHTRQGATAVELARRLPMIPSTKFGFGTDRIVFNYQEDFHVRFACKPNGTFALEDVHLLNRIGPDAAAALVKTLNEWRKEWLSTDG